MQKRILFLSVLLIFVFMSSLVMAQAAGYNYEAEEKRSTVASQGLFFALAENDISNMSALRDQGANPNATMSMLGLKGIKVFGHEDAIFASNVKVESWPILSWAAYFDNLPVVSFLLRAGARVNAVDIDGATPLHWAAWANSHKSAKELLNNGASCWALDKKGRTPKDWAVMVGNTEMIRLLDGRNCRKQAFGDQDRDGVPDNLDLCPDTPFGAPVDDRGCWIVAYASFFDFDKAVVKPEYIPHIEDAAKIIKEGSQQTINVEGHTDAVGNADYNYKLGLRRAEAVKVILIKNAVEAARLKVSSKGETSPAADNKTTEGRKRNRRVELHVGQVGTLK